MSDQVVYTEKELLKIDKSLLDYEHNLERNPLCKSLHKQFSCVPIFYKQQNNSVLVFSWKGH